MATVKAFIRVSKKNSLAAKVRFRLSDGRDKQFHHTSEKTIEPHFWDSKNEQIRTKIKYEEAKRLAFNNFITDRKRLILEIYNDSLTKDGLSPKWIDDEINQILYPQKFAKENNKAIPTTYFELYDTFLEERGGSDRMKQHYMAVKRMLMRFELFTKKTYPNFDLTLDNFDSNLLRQFDKFIIEEHKLYQAHKDIYKAVPDSRPPKRRGQNRRNKIFRYIRTFSRWAITNQLTTNNPFSRFKIREDVVGTPIYISIEERNRLYNYNLTEHPKLEIQRDIFIFQCVIGCRVGDLVKLKKDNIIEGAIEYIPRKTKDGRPITVRVPLNKTAKEIVTKYLETDSTKLLPFIAEQHYNYAIKDIFRLAGLTRMVTVINTITGNEERKPLNKVASSHLARRTFAGNLYKKVKDPNLVGSLTGHKEGSKAFARYRAIDDDIKNDLVKLLE
jgi:integrase